MNNKTLEPNIQNWVDALRSGDYPQCQDTLHDGKGFCCLGVYAMVNGVATAERMLVNSESSGYIPHEGPVHVYEDIKKAIGSDIQDWGISMNDNGFDFKTIADGIEDYFTTGRLPKKVITQEMEDSYV